MTGIKKRLKELKRAREASCRKKNKSFLLLDLSSKRRNIKMVAITPTLVCVRSEGRFEEDPTQKDSKNVQRWKRAIGGAFLEALKTREKLEEPWEEVWEKVGKKRGRNGSSAVREESRITRVNKTTSRTTSKLVCEASAAEQNRRWPL